MLMGGACAKAYGWSPKKGLTTRAAGSTSSRWSSDSIRPRSALILIDLRPGGFHDLAPSGAFGAVVLFEFIGAGCGGLATDITQGSRHRGQIPHAFHFRCDSLDDRAWRSGR